MNKEELRELENQMLVEGLHYLTGNNPTMYSPSNNPPEPFWHTFAWLSEKFENDYPVFPGNDIISKIIDNLRESMVAVVSDKWCDDFSLEEDNLVSDLMWDASIKIFNYLVSYIGNKDAISIYLSAISERVINPYTIKVEIQTSPSKVKVDSNQVVENECFKNSCKVALNNSNVVIVEGVIRLKTIESGAKVIPHVWNRYDSHVHFDVTKDFIFNDHPEIDSIEYFPGLVYYADDVKRIHKWEFTIKTESIAFDLNDMLD